MTYSLLDLGLILTIFSRILSAPHRPTPAVCRVPSSSLRPHAFRLRNYACDPMLWMRHVLIFYIFFDESIYRALLIFKYVYVCFGGFFKRLQVDNDCVVTNGRLSFYGNLSKKRPASPEPIRTCQHGSVGG